MEKWVDVIGFEGLYQVSNLGCVKSFGRTIYGLKQNGGSRKIAPRILKPVLFKNGKGYLFVNLVDIKGKRTTAFIHRIVAENFLSKNGMNEVNHINCNSRDNSVENLEWCTHKQNMEHAAKNKLMVSTVGPGEKSHANKLTETMVKEIKIRILSGEPLIKICKDYPVTVSAIKNIKNGNTWRFVTI